MRICIWVSARPSAMLTRGARARPCTDLQAGALFLVSRGSWRTCWKEREKALQTRNSKNTRCNTHDSHCRHHCLHRAENCTQVEENEAGFCLHSHTHCQTLTGPSIGDKFSIRHVCGRESSSLTDFPSFVHRDIKGFL